MLICLNMSIRYYNAVKLGKIVLFIGKKIHIAGIAVSTTLQKMSQLLTNM